MIPTAGFKMQPFDLSSCLVFLFLIIDGINSNENKLGISKANRHKPHALNELSGPHCIVSGHK